MIFSFPMISILIVVGLASLVGSVYWVAAMITRLKERYKDLSKQVLATHRDVAVIREAVGQFQQIGVQIQEIGVQIQEIGVQIERQIALEQLSDLVRRSTEEGVVDRNMGSRMLKHIWQLREDALLTERASY